jgi:hypothetical protein
MSLRPGTPQFLAAVKQRLVRGAWLVEIEFTTTTVRYITRVGSLVWQGITWSGMVGPGQGSVIASISAIEETDEIKAAGITVGLSGVPVIAADGRNLLKLVESAVSQNGLLRIWTALFDLTTGALLADPNQDFEGRLSVPVIEVGPDTFTVSISAEGDMDTLKGRPGQRYNQETLNKYYPGDRGLEFVTRSVNQVDNFA